MGFEQLEDGSSAFLCHLGDNIKSLLVGDLAIVIFFFVVVVVTTAEGVQLIDRTVEDDSAIGIRDGNHGALELSNTSDSKWQLVIAASVNPETSLAGAALCDSLAPAVEAGIAGVDISQEREGGLASFFSDSVNLDHGTVKCLGLAFCQLDAAPAAFQLDGGSIGEDQARCGELAVKPPGRDPVGGL
jgi:hypothetical protein